MVRSVAVALVLAASGAWAWRCTHGAQSAGFVSYAKNRHLPANAKGVLFVMPLPTAPTIESGDHSVAYFLRELPPAIDLKAFSAIDTTTGDPLTVTLRSLGLQAEESWGVTA
jgi:hypothetical protein